MSWVPKLFLLLQATPRGTFGYSTRQYSVSDHFYTARSVYLMVPIPQNCQVCLAYLALWRLPFCQTDTYNTEREKMTYWQAPPILPTQCLSLPLHPMEIQVTKSVKALANSDNFTKQKLLKHLRRCPAQMGTSSQRGGASEEGGKTRWDWRHQEHPGENIYS